MRPHELLVSIHFHGIDAPLTLRYTRLDPRAETNDIAHQLRHLPDINVNGLMVPLSEIRQVGIETGL